MADGPPKAVHALRRGDLVSVDPHNHHAPTNGSYHFGFEFVASEPVDDAYFVLSTASGARAQSSSFSIYPRQSLSIMSVGATTLYKGMAYDATWNSTGLPFPVSILLYYGIPDERSTVSGDKCLEWKDGGLTGRDAGARDLSECLF